MTTPRSEPLGDDTDATEPHVDLRDGSARGAGRRGASVAPGSSFGRYVVLDHLGKGGMGIVLRAFDRELDRPVALKVLHDDLGERHTARLRREARAMARLSHPNVVQVYEVGEVDGRTFVAMELVRGRTVREWAQQEPRPDWRACVELFVQLGEGLAAAHERGLVHRDFKPTNAIIDDQGRARVLDFGLARYADGGDTNDGPSPVSIDPDEDASVEAPLTKTGTVLGTPAYMPLEQMNGTEADALSDQFSFCVSLYEIVYGQRPFAGRSLVKLMMAMRSGAVRPAPKGSRVPAGLRKVLLRGLATEPEQRWPSMQALLGALRRLLVPRRRRWTTAALTAGLLAVGGGLAFGEYVRARDRCTGAQAQLDGIWDDARRQAAKTAILGTELPYAPDTWQRVERALDAYAEAWVREHTEVCEATVVRHEQSEEHRDLRMGCLRQRRQYLAATVGELGRADTRMVEKAVQVVAQLPELSRCADVEALEAEVPPPEDPDVAQRVEALEDRLAAIDAKQAAGRYDDALVEIDAVEQQARTLDHEPLMARIWLRQGRVQANKGDYETAVTTYRRAYDAAVARGMSTEASVASTNLMFVLAEKLARYDDARRWAEHADPLSRATGTDQSRARYLTQLGLLARLEGKLDEARDLQQRALALQEKAPEIDRVALAESLSGLGMVVESQGKLDEARRLYERALAIKEEELGPRHPYVGAALGSMGVVAARQGKLEEARAFQERALVILEDALGPDHPHVAAPLTNLGILIGSQGDLERARDSLQRARAIAEKAVGPDHPSVAIILSNLGNLARSQGRLDEARALHERALGIYDAALGPRHPSVATSLINLGTVAQTQGQLEDARDYYERALAILEQVHGSDHPLVATALTDLGIVASLEDDADQARDFHQRALAIREKAFGPEHPEVVASLCSLGLVARWQGELEQARDFYARAVATAQQVHEPDHPAVALALTGLGGTLYELGEPTEALPSLERALAVRTAHEADPGELAATRFELARALWAAPATEGRDRPRARALAEQAHGAWAEAGAGWEEDRAQAERWLAEHPPPGTG